MAKRRRHTDEEEETGETSEETGETTEETTEPAKPEPDEQQQKVIDGLEEKQKEALSNLEEKLGEGEDATSEFNALQDINQDLKIAKSTTTFVPPTGAPVGAGAAGCCYVDDTAHAIIESIGGIIADPEYSGHASIALMVQPAPPPGPWGP